MALSFKLPKFGAGEKKDENAPMTVLSGLDAGDAAAGSLLPQAFLRKPVVQQMKILGGVFFALFVLIVALVFVESREAANSTAYAAASGEMRMLSQRLAKSSAQAMQGDAVAFAQMKESRETFALLLDRLTQGGDINGVGVSASPDYVGPQLAALTERWTATDKDAQTMLEKEKNLLEFGKSVATIDAKNSVMLKLTEQFAAIKLQGGASARETADASRMVMLTQRIAKNALELRASGEFDAAVAKPLGEDIGSFSELLQGSVRAGNEGAARDKLGEIEANFKEYQSAINSILGDMPSLVPSKQAGSRIIRDSEDLLKATDDLAKGYQAGASGRFGYTIALVLLTLLALGTLALLAKIYLEDTRRRALESERQRQASELTNRENQEAILRLMNELGDLADGDLTVTATVSENITGAIADSINYTIEELRVLVGRINDAANRVTAATEIARQTSAELLEAAERQSTEIQEAGQSALHMARSMSEVSGNANQSAQVARQSLAAAEKGTLAVQDSIKGMNEIRNQIQETSKRIKRLGESSQEIGEIVELISDITEQTNVLALNAAIQAASAGDAGRGFTVVAEEVQRLAERSAEATKQIAAIVKTIQTDTQDAVSAMEKSTQGVVEGAKLSDAAGQALTEIGQVSRDLADLIQNISTSTESQANTASQVATLMQDILRVNEQTTAGTQRTAEAVDELTSLASELKGSVAGFKVD